jgi:hypothetical protein
MFAFATGFANAQSRTPVIVELFTSEGCSSCPPADALLARLPRSFNDIEIIPMSEHVDYWNNLGWKDRFSSALFTDRQQDYGRVFRKESVYTPEIVVNGQWECSGNDPSAVQQAIRKSADGPKANAKIVVVSPGVVRVAVDNVPAGVKNADVFLAVTESSLETVPNKGENNGTRLRHTGVVRSLISLARLDLKNSANYTADAKLNPNPDWRQENLQYVVFVQDRSSRRIIGAAALRPFAR